MGKNRNNHKTHGSTNYGRGPKDNRLKAMTFGSIAVIYLAIIMASPIQKTYQYSASRYPADLMIRLQKGLIFFIPQFNEYTVGFIFVFLIVYALICSYYLMRRPHPFKDKEYGSSRLISAKEITEKYTEDPKEEDLLDRFDDHGNSIKINCAERRFSENIFITVKKNTSVNIISLESHQFLA